MNLKDWMTKNRYTQSQFAKLLTEAGWVVDRRNVWSWLNGTTPRSDYQAGIELVTSGRVKGRDFPSHE